MEKVSIQATRTNNSNRDTMNYQQANPTNEEVNSNTDGNEDSKTADGPGDESHPTVRA
jgi:hypothetical protein